MDLSKYLKKYQITNSGVYNYVLLTYPTGKYYIPDTAEETEKLHNVILNCKKQDIDFGLCECHSDELDEPLYYDLDFSLLKEVDISDDLLKQLIKMINDSITKYLSFDDSELKCFVMRKSNYLEKKISEGYWHIGVHLMYPYIRTNEIGRRIIYSRLIKDIKKHNIFNHLPLYEDKIEQIIDYRVIKTNSIIKFGCNKAQKERYEIYKILDNHLTEIPNDFSELELMDLLSIRSNLWRDIKVNTPFRLNVDLDKIKEELLIETTIRKDVKENKKAKREITGEQFERIRRLIGMLSEKRSKNYDTWIQVGLCLHNISDTPEMMEIWKEWSQKCQQKANKTNFTKIWKSFKQRDDGLKIGTLTLWAKEDNEREFLLFKLDEIDKKIRASIDGNTHYDIAKVLREMYDGIYICAKLTKSPTWYEFRKHRYVEIQEGYTLFINISEELVREYQKKELDIETQCLELRKKLHSAEVYNTQVINDEIEQYKSRIVTIQKIIKNLKETSFKNKVMTEARNLFYDEEFDKHLNETRNLLVFNNGVYDLEKREFRNGRPEDYMSYTTGINYMEYCENDPDIQKVYHIFSQIHPDEENRHFFFITLAAGLHGVKREQKLDLWTGSGGNGKSVAIDFLSKSLGDFFDAPPITMLTRKRGNSSQASPELAKLKGKRTVCFLEPEFDDQLHTSMMKQFFGNDWIEARGLFKEPTKFKPQASGFLACNKLPNIPSNDGGTWRRIRVLEFKSKFVDEPTEPHHFKKDPMLTEQIDYLTEAFVSILIFYWGKLQKNNYRIKEPEDVTQFTKKYQTESDLYLEFIEDCIETVEDQKIRMFFKPVWETFKVWHKENRPNDKVPNKIEVKKQLEGILGETTRGWTGKRLKDPNDEHQEFI